MFKPTLFPDIKPQDRPYPFPCNPEPYKPTFTVQENLLETTKRVNETLDRVLRMEEHIRKTLESFTSTITADNVAFKNLMTTTHNQFASEVTNEINAFEADLTNAYSTLSTDCKNQIETMTASYIEQANAYKAELNETYDNFRDAVECRLEQYNSNYVQAFNDYVTEMNLKLSTMETKFNNDYTTFTVAINQNITEFKNVWTKEIETRLDGQDSVINDAVLYLKTNLNATLENLVSEMHENGEFAEIVEREVFTDLANKSVEILNVKMYGAKGDGLTDDTAIFQEALNTKKKLYIPNGRYKITEPLTAYNSIEADKDAVIEFYPDAYGETCISVRGSVERIAENIGCVVDGKTLTIDTQYFSEVSAGDFVYLSNNELASSYGREYDTKRDILQIESISDGHIIFTTAPVHNYETVNVDLMHLVNGVVIDGLKIECKAKCDYTNGIILAYCKNATVRNCSVVGFDYAGINYDYCVLSDIHSNYCEVNYSVDLQYGIVIHSSSNVSVYGNKINSERTAIDVTRLSNKVTVSNNTVVGSINTHSATNVTITGNTINEGMILIRGKNTTVTNNTVEAHEIYCIDIEEMGIEGGHVISNNTFKGYCSMKAYPSDISIVNNKFIVDKVLEYQNTNETFESVIRIFQTKTVHKNGVLISGNTFDYMGSKPPMYCIEGNSNLNTIYNVVIIDNIIRNFETAINLAQLSGIVGYNLIIKNNLMEVTKNGLYFRLADNTQITGNTIICVGEEKGSKGIWRVDIASIETTGLIIKENIIKNFEIGVRYGGAGNTFKTIYCDNIFVGVDTESSGISGNTSRIANEVFIASATGAVYKLTVDDSGTLTATLQNFPQPTT